MKLNIRFIIRSLINGTFIDSIGLPTEYFEKAVSFSKKENTIEFIIKYKLQDVQIIEWFDYSNTIYSDET